MLIARAKRKENVAEYILYMWRVEDTIRACNFDMDLIEKHVISQFNEPERVKQEIRDWYADLLLNMYEEGLKESGHMQMVNHLVDELYDVHFKLMLVIRDETYQKMYASTVDIVDEFERKLEIKPRNLVETCLSALYALLLLRLQKKEISKGTLEAMQSFSYLLAQLSHWFKKFEEGKAES